MISRVARLLALAALALLPMWLVGGAVGQGIGVLTVTGAQASEGDALRFRVNLSPALTSDVVVELETRIDGRTGAAAATPDSDFPSSSARRLTIHAGSTGAWFTVPTVEDGLYEGDETFELRIADVAEGLAQIGAADRAIGTIVEDDPMPQVSLHQSASGVIVDNAQGVDDAELTLEGGSASEPAEIVYRVYLSSPSGLDTTVPYTLSGTATADLDYTDPAVKQLVIPAGELSGVISITTLPDTLGEDHETLIVTLGAATNATVASGAGEATGRIFDDDQAKHIVLSLTPHRVPESVSTEMTYTLSASLGGGATADSAVLIESRVGGLLIVGGGHTATHGADFGLRDAVEGKIGLNITIPAGQNSGSNTFNGTITNDTLDEFDEAIGFGHDINRVANTGELWGTHNGYSFFYPRLTIIDNDGAHVPTLSVADAAAVQEGNDASVTTDMHFAVSLSAASGKDVTVWYALGGTATAGDDYDTPPLSLTIEAGSTSGRVTLPVRGDRADEGSSETVVLTLLGADHADLVQGGTAAEKRALDLVGDWAWLRPGHLAALLGVGRRRLTQLLARLDDLGLVTRVPRAGAPRLTLSDRGLAYLARRDRTSVGIARKRWSPEPRGSGDAFDWRNVSGIRSRQLLRNLEHTESVHWFNTLLASQARDQGSRLVQLDPPHRASRYFRSFERTRSIQPDAYALLETPSGEQALFLEWERRAVRPATMAARLAPYLRYYATSRPLEDHGLLPRVLVVFEDKLAADHFLRIAADAVARAEVPLPLLVSDRLRLEQHGPLGRAWRSVEHRAPRGLD